jgi:hypothetical protein
MPFVVGEGDPAWDNQPEDEEQIFKISDFQYVENIAYPARPDGPVTFALDLPAVGSVRAATAAKPTLLDRLLGRAAKAPEAFDSVKGFEEREKQYQDDSRRFLAAVTVAMRAAGVKSAYGHYNGGNDEGFSNFGRFMSASGSALELQDVTARLAKTDLASRLAAFRPDRAYGGEAGVLGEEIAEVCSVLLLGSGYGNGPFLMYGGFTIDFDACTITDDPAAEPEAVYGIER